MRSSVGCWWAVGLLLGVAGCASPPPVAVPAMGMEPSHVVVVTGVGEAKGAPDLVTVTVGVQKRSTDVERALADASRALARVVEAMAAAGVAPSDLQTSQVNVGLEEPPPGFFEPVTGAPSEAPVSAPRPPEEPSSRRRSMSEHGFPSQPASPAGASLVLPAAPQPEVPRALQGYSVSMSVTARIRQAGRVGEVMAAAFSAGANVAYGVEFGWQEPAGWLDVARRAAVEDAKRRAREIARLSEVRLSRVLSIVEQNCGAGAGGPGVPYGAQPMAMVAPMPVPFEQGQLTASCTVRLAYGIEP